MCALNVLFSLWGLGGQDVGDVGLHKALDLLVLLLWQEGGQLGQFGGLGVPHEHKVGGDALLHGAGAVHQHPHEHLTALRANGRHVVSHAVGGVLKKYGGILT